jgi:tetratricopeptide (TPR) repeat protein
MDRKRNARKPRGIGARRGLFAVLAMAGLVAATAPAQDNRQQALEFLRAGDSLYAAFDYAGALSQYQAAVSLDTTLAEAMWKCARSFVDAGDRAEDKKQRRELYVSAVRYARWAVRVAPQDSRAHLWDAIAVGKLALFEGGKKKIALSKEVRREALAAIARDSTNDSAYHVLARWHREVANLSGVLKVFAKILYGGVPPGASNDSALYYFEKAIALKPTHINHYLELGKTYMELDRWEDAAKALEKALSLPRAELNDERYQEEAKELLEKVRKRLK